MKRIRLIAILAVLAVIAAACGSGDPPATTQPPPATTQPPPATTQPPPATTVPGGEDNPLEAYGENPQNADAALIARALGPVTPSEADSWNILLAAVARADQNPSEAIIAKALECWAGPECDTGTGGPLVMGYADGGGNQVNVWRSVSHMEAVLQALTYPEIGKIVSTEANFAQELTPHVTGISVLIDYPVDFIVGYPDAGLGLAQILLEAKQAGIPYISFSAGYVGLPDQDGALVPGEDYLSVVGEDLCALGNSFADVLNTGLGSGDKVALLGGTPNNALSLGWQRCVVTGLGSGLNLVNAPPDTNTTAGDTFWYAPAIPGVFQGLLGANPTGINGWAYEYADGMYFGLPEFTALGIPIANMTFALRTDEQNLFCEWRDANEPTWNIFYSAGGNFQSRIAVTAAMMETKGADIPARLVVPHVMREVTAADCNDNRPNAEASGTSLVPDSVMRRMFSSN